jgi:serine/threonine-protein kinase
LQAEARFAARISHPNIVEVFDFGEHDGLAFLVMELIEGPSLAQLLAEEGPLDSVRARRLVVQLSAALARAHESGVIHRDVKPSNVLISVDGLAKLTDFGIAKEADATVHTTPGEVYGTTYYLSPEQALGEVVTAASDLYSLGVVAHELLTGARPFDRGTPIATALATVVDPPPPLPDDVAPDLRSAVTACLAKDPAERPTATGLLEALAGPEGAIVVPDDTSVDPWTH